MKWSINSLKSQLDSVNEREADTDDVKDLDSSDKEGNHEKRQRSNKVNPTLTRKLVLIKNKRIDYNSS